MTDFNSRVAVSKTLSMPFEGAQRDSPPAFQSLMVFTLPDMATVILNFPQEFDMYMEAKFDTAPDPWKVGALLASTSTPPRNRSVSRRQVFAAAS